MGVFGYGLWFRPSFPGLGLRGLRLGLGFGLHLTILGWGFGACVAVCALRLYPAVPGSGVPCGPACWGSGPGCALPLLGEVLGCLCVCVLVPRGLLHLLAGGAVRGCVLELVSRPAPLGWVGGVCVPLCVCPACTPPFLGAACGAGVCGCCRGWGLPPPPPPLWFFLGGALRRPWVSWSLSPHPLSFGLRLRVFFSSSVVCVRVFRVSLLLWAAAPGLLLPVLAGWSPGVSSGWGVWPPLVVWAGSFVAVGLSRAPPPVFFSGGVLPVPPSAFPGLVQALVGIQCGLPGCCWCLRFARPCPGPMGRVGCVHIGLGVPCCRVRFLLCRLGGCARRLREVLDLGGWGFLCPFASAVLVLTF